MIPQTFRTYTSSLPLGPDMFQLLLQSALLWVGKQYVTSLNVHVTRHASV